MTDQTTNATDGSGFGTSNEPEKRVIPVIEESIRIDKKVVETGRVSIEKRVLEEEVVLDLGLSQEHIQVEKKEINAYVEVAPPAVRYEGDTMIVSVVREEAVLVKRLILVEELHITRQTSESRYTSSATIRKEEVHITKTETETRNE